MQRVFRPAIVRPSQIAIISSGNGMPYQPTRFSRFRKSKSIGIGLYAAGIYSRKLSAPPPFFSNRIRQRVPVCQTEVIHLRFYLRIIVSSPGNFICRISTKYQIKCFLHHTFLPFVHSNSGFPEPTFLTQMPGKVFQETEPIVLISGFAGFGFYKADTISSLIVIVELQCPGHQRIAINLTINAQTHHKLHPTVEYSIIVYPTSVNLLHTEHHTVKRVFCLSRPGMMHHRGRDYFLSRICQLPHQGLHDFKMLPAPQRNLIIACHGIRVLPQIEVKSPLVGSR